MLMRGLRSGAGWEPPSTVTVREAVTRLNGGGAGVGVGTADLVIFGALLDQQLPHVPDWTRTARRLGTSTWSAWPVP